MHVLFLSSWYPTRRHHLNGNFVVKHAESVARFENVSFLHVDSDDHLIKKVELLKSVVNGVHHYLFYFKNSKIPVLKYFLNPLRKIRLYIKGFILIKKEKGEPDIVHANILFPIGLIACLFKWLFSKPFVVTEHWTIYTPDSDQKLSTFKLWLIKIISKRATRILPVTKNLSVSMGKYQIPGRFEVIPNVVDIDLFNTVTKRKTEQKRMIHVSSLNDKQKNITGILNVIQKLTVKRNDFELLIICCQTENKKKFEKEVIRRGLQNMVLFEEDKTPGEVGQLMQSSDFLVLFSNFENLPCVIVEAFACGLPVISTNVGGISEHVNEERGILIHKQNEDDLFTALDWMLDHCGDYKKQAIRKYAEENFSYSQIGQSFISVYKKVLTNV